jgi:hypothetical protein
MGRMGRVGRVRRVGALAVGVVVLLGVARLPAQQRGQGAAAPQAPRTPRQAAPTDFTGNWVAVITEDWRFRMVTPPKGDFASVPLNDAGQKLANTWDPAKDVAAGEQCRAYGAAGLMRMPIRLRVSWQDDTTLKLESDNGQQVRLFKFGNPPTPATPPDWQGHSVAQWETFLEGQGQAAGGGGGGGGGRGGGGGGPQLSGSLKVVTTRMKPGYLRRNGVPYSGQAVLTEYFDRTSESNGDSWLILTSTVEDPANLAQPFMTSTHFKREADGSKWAPRPCEVTPEVRGRTGRAAAN